MSSKFLPDVRVGIPEGFFGKFDPMIKEGTALIIELRATNQLVQRFLQQQLTPEPMTKRRVHSVT